MKTDELIKKLQNLKKRHGNINVNIAVKTSSYNYLMGEIENIQTMEDFSHDIMILLYTDIQRLLKI